MKRYLLRLRNGGQIEVEVNLTTQSPKNETKLGDPYEINEQQEKKTKWETEMELKSERTPNFENKGHFLKDVKC